MGESLSLVWALPFAGMLLSIALCPLVAPHFWHHHFKKVSVGWAMIFAVPFYLFFRGEAIHEIVHILVVDYVPFVILLWALFTISGGILLRGSLVGTPRTNTLLMLLGASIASLVGTTGASMLLVRPILRANEKRQHKAHTLVFFIFLVSNLGGCLTPLGDPPLFLGFLHHVPFSWTLTNLWPHFLFGVLTVATIYFVVDTYLWRFREAPESKLGPAVREPLALEGKANLILLVGVVGAVLMSGSWKPTNINWGNIVKDGALIVLPDHHESHPAGASAAAAHAETESATTEHKSHAVAIPIQNVARDLLLIVLLMVSLFTTPKKIHEANGFGWGPILEVAWLFFGIFVTIIPALMILTAGDKGALAFVVKQVNSPASYFWVSGLLSSVLDNAPTYLTFFNTALGQFFPDLMKQGLEAEAVARLIAEQNKYLVGIAIGSVFMGANTYIGNAPNFMVRSIAEESGVKMPDFFSYILKYSLPVLGSTFVLMTFVFFRS